jgi:hypothetical protein
LHAGAGTSTCALRAGTPQLTLPMYFDQPAWAERLQQMGVGRRLDPKRVEAPTTARVEAPTTARMEAPTTAREEALTTARVGRRLDPKESDAKESDAKESEARARGAVDYFVGQLRYVSMSEGVRAGCEL